MKLTAYNILEHSFVITVNDERYKLFNRIFKANNLLPLPKRFNGVCDTRNSSDINTYLSHKEVILLAKHTNMPYVCVFEDDAYPCCKVCNKLNVALGNIPNNCGLLTFGWIKMLSCRKYNEHLTIDFKSYGAQSYVVFNSMYDEYIKLLDEVKAGDAFQTENKDGKKFFATSKPLFIQFTQQNSIHGHNGYTYRELDNCPFSDKQIFKMGFEPLETMLSSKCKQQSAKKKFNDFYFG